MSPDAPIFETARLRVERLVAVVSPGNGRSIQVLERLGFAFERVSGTLHGLRGGFTLQHSGTMTRGEPRLTVTVVPDSGTDGLAGLAGSMSITIAGKEHSYDFKYTLAPNVV